MHKMQSTKKLTLTVRGDVNLIRQLSDVHLEAFLDVIQDLGIILIRHKGDGQTLCTKATSTSHLVDNHNKV